MQIDEKTFAALPAHLKHLFVKQPNPGSDEVLAAFPESKDGVAGKRGAKNGEVMKTGLGAYEDKWGGYGGGGSNARFFYCAKASKKDRGEGNAHPTVKPIALMRYLCRLVTPPGGTVLDPYAGSGSTWVAAQAEGFKFIGFENDPASCAIANRRMGLTGLLAVNKERRQLRIRKQLLE